ncbi:MAG: hypothetical protein H6680_01990 [Desulfobacteraceae bacterium]|nr:hypothetical protein [Desulfobacteraceae bacterium]
MMGKFFGFLQQKSSILKWLFFIFLAGTVCFDFFVPRHGHGHFFGDSIIGFWGFFGLIGCLVMIIFCKGIAHSFLMKDVDYYWEDEDEGIVR